jgi:predicted NUDIX family phosphoesterase
MNKDKELILVVPRTHLEKAGGFQGFSPEGEKYLKALIDTKSATFTERGPAEKNPTLKQIIPYCLIVQEDKILIYQRGKTGGEERLKSLWSCGIGGHINPIDSTEEHSPFTRASLKKALLREISEEISLPNVNEKIEFITAGLINDDSNPVGEVHLGLIEIAKVPPGRIEPLEEAISNVKMITARELQAMRKDLESWSQIVADNIDQILETEKAN